MTIFVPQWATSLNYSAGPDVGTPTKVDPSSIPNGFVSGAIAAPQHINFLFNGLSKEIVKAIDGVGGGTYTLAEPLIFEGADVRITDELEILGNLDINDGAELNVKSLGKIRVESGGILDVLDGGLLDVDGAASVNLDGTLDVQGGGVVDVKSGGRVDVQSGGELQLNAGATLDINCDVDLIATATFALNGTLEVRTGGAARVLSGGALEVQSGGHVTVQDGADVRIDQANDLFINASAEAFRLTLTPAFHDLSAPWETTTAGSGLLGWVQSDVADDRSIWFALPINPGDTVIDIYARVEAEDHPGGLPATMPSIELLSTDSDGVITVHATKVDSAATEAAYDAVHNIVLQAGAETSGSMPHVATFDPLYVRVRGESAANAVTGLCLRSISGTVIARSYRASSMIY